MNFTLPKPKEKYDVKDQSDVRTMVERIARFLFESTNSLTSRGMAGEIHALVTNDTADLTLDVSASKVDYPIGIKVYEGTPSGTPLVDTTITLDSTLNKLSPGCASLGARALPQRELQRWWMLLTNAAGVELWCGPTAADRDALPYGAVSTKDSVITIEYDDDVDDIRITLPTGQTKTWSGLSGGGTKTYTVGDALDSGSPEAALLLDETRLTYIVDVRGGGTWLTMFRGALKGPKSSNVVAKLPATVSNDIADLTLVLTATAAAFPVAWEVTEDDPTTTPIASGSASSNTTYTKVGVPALGGRTLPLRELRRWWVKTTDVTGAVHLWGPTSADRDAIPSAAVTTIGGIIKVDYDDDTDKVKVTVPSGKTKTFSSLVGSGTATYTVGDALDDTTTEGPLALDEQRGTYKVEVQGNAAGPWITVFNGKLLGPKGDNVTAKLVATVSSTTADLSLVIAGSSTAFPVAWSVYEDDPTTAAIASGSAASASTITKVGVAALGGRTLPLREVRRWWAKTVDVHGHELLFGPTAADRDALPYVNVSPGIGLLKMDYDDDCTSIKVTVPGGRTKTYSGLSGGGTQTYTIGNTLDDTTSEAAIAADEQRAGYIVEATGGGVTLKFYQGPIFGSNKDYTQGSLDVTVSPASDKYTFTYTAAGGHTVQRRIDTGAWATAPSSPFDITRNVYGGADKTVQLRVVRNSDSFEGAPRTFTVPAVTSAGASAAVVTAVYVSAVDYTLDQVTVSWAYTGAVLPGTFTVYRIRTASATPDLSGTQTNVGTSSSSSPASIVDSVPDDIISTTGPKVTYSYQVRVYDSGGTLLRVSEWVSVTYSHA